jgi:uncharacterized protein (TIGR02246 family)
VGEVVSALKSKGSFWQLPRNKQTEFANEFGFSFLLRRLKAKCIKIKSPEVYPMAISTEIRGIIGNTNERFMGAFKKGDAPGVASLYTVEGQLLPPNSDVVTGRASIEEVWKSVMGMGIKDAKLESVEVDALGDTAVEVGRYTLSGEGGQVLDTGKYVVIWKKEDDAWRYHRDIWNSSMPLPGQG